MKKIYHYTKASTLIEHILPNMTLRSNYLSEMNDPREMEAFVFGGTNVPYSKMYAGHYNKDTQIDCMYKLGDEIKGRIQVICFSGANEDGWNNEMMWAHYGDKHKGICIEIDQDVIIHNMKTSNQNFKIDNVDYAEEADTWLNWDNNHTIDENITYFISNKYKDLAFKKSNCWKPEDEIRLMLINETKQVYVSLINSITSVYLGRYFVMKYLPSIKSQLPSNVQLFLAMYQNYKFEKWDV